MNKPTTILTSLLSSLIICTLFSVNIIAKSNQADTVKISQIYNPPTIDGLADDACWDSASWQNIDQVWIPYGSTIDSSDFYGRYKVLWSSATNLLYFLSETTDNIFVDGYIYRSSPAGNNYPDFDVLEVFIDENRSKGKHVFDGTGQTGIDWGYNAENAFSYHIGAMAPQDGEVTTDKIVCDISGTDWSDEYIRNYESHFPEFALKKDGNKYTWEFSMKVYKDTYNPKNPSDTSLAILKAGKVMGLDIAYCDDDTPQDIKRKSFIGSSYVTAAKYNDHWMDAGDFGLAILQAKSIDNSITLNKINGLKASYSEISNDLSLSFPNELNGPVSVEMFNLLGTLVLERKLHVSNGSVHINLPSEMLSSGIYILNINQGSNQYVSKIFLN